MLLPMIWHCFSCIPAFYLTSQLSNRPVWLSDRLLACLRTSSVGLPLLGHWLRGQPDSNASLPNECQPAHAPACNCSAMGTEGILTPVLVCSDPCASLMSRASLQLWAIGTEGDLRPLRTFAKAPVPISAITLHPSGRALLVAQSDGGLSLYSTQDLAVVYSHSHEGPIKRAEFMSTDDIFLVSGSKVRPAEDCEQISERFKVCRCILPSALLHTGWCRADPVLGTLNCTAWCQAARYECKGELQHGAALLLSAQRLAELIRFTTVCRRTAKACRWHAVPASCIRARAGHTGRH